MNPPPPLQGTGGDWYLKVSKTRQMPHYMGTIYGVKFPTPWGHAEAYLHIR